MEWLSSTHQIISYYKEQFVTSVYFTHGQQVTLPLQSLMLPLLKNQLHSFRVAAFLQQIFNPHGKSLPAGCPSQCRNLTVRYA
jgi:hypothetical protein